MIGAGTIKAADGAVLAETQDGKRVYAEAVSYTHLDVYKRQDLKRMDTGRIVLADSGGVAPDTLAFLRGVIRGKTGCKELILADAGCTTVSYTHLDVYKRQALSN